MRLKKNKIKAVVKIKNHSLYASINEASAGLAAKEEIAESDNIIHMTPTAKNIAEIKNALLLFLEYFICTLYPFAKIFTLLYYIIILKSF